MQGKYEGLNNKLRILSEDQSTKPDKHVNFYSRVVNNRNITFTKSEIALLEKGPKYNLHNRKKNWLTTLALEAKTAINSLVLPIQQYQQKIKNFINNNNFRTTSTNPTKTYQGQIRKTINNSTTLIGPDSRWKYINLNPTEPTIRGLVKLHETDQPIRPVVN
jgi:hypothetical protein